MDNIDFGDLGLEIGDEIYFRKGKLKFIVCSGNGTPGNGGTLIRCPDSDGYQLYSLHYMTKRLMGDEFNETGDIFELWEFEGVILRDIWRRKPRSG